MFSLIKEKEEQGYSSANLPLPVPKNDEVLIKVTKVSLMKYYIIYAVGFA